MSDKVIQCDTEYPSSQNSFDDPESFASVDSYDQPIHSLLLCPAQWTALLESSPISLVRERELNFSSHPLTEEKCQGPDSDERKEVERNSSEDEKTVQRTCERPQLEKDHSDFGTGVIEEEEEEEADEMNKHQMAAQMEEEREKETKPPLQGCGNHHLLPLPQCSGGGGSSLGSDDSSDTTTCVMNSSRVEEQLILPRHEPPPVSSGGGGSAPHTPQSESRLPLSYLTTNLTHSRNISETPSLPPYISSSTSSAYHSRNSSMASQITSDCFDSDSQFTDIDSCIVLQSGGGIGGSDRPVSLQDGRCYKFPDTPTDEMTGSSRKGCYSVCEMSPGKVRMPDHIVVTSPLTLEDTLKQASTTAGGGMARVGRSEESFEVKHEASALKSSEWIKRVMAIHSRHSMVHVKVSSKTKHVVHFNVKAGDLIIWEFATKRKDVGLGMSFEATEVATVESPEPPDDELLQKKMTSILPILRVNSHSHPIIGSHTATQDGVYEIVFDNSYSRFFAKELFYRITTQPSEPNENYLHQ